MLRFNKPFAQPSDYDATNEEEYEQTTIENSFYNAALIALDFAYNLTLQDPQLNESQIFFGGHSEGAQYAPSICQQRQSILRGCLVMANVVEGMNDVIPWQNYYLDNLNVALLNQSYACLEYFNNPYFGPPDDLVECPINYAYLFNEYWLSMRAYNTSPNVVEQLTMPVLVMQGTADYNVPYFATPPYPFYGWPLKTFMSEDGWYDRFAGSSRVSLAVFSDLCHLFYKTELNNASLSTPDAELAKNNVNQSVVLNISDWITAIVNNSIG